MVKQPNCVVVQAEGIADALKELFRNHFGAMVVTGGFCIVKDF
jgi:hypothetical protein